MLHKQQIPGQVQKFIILNSLHIRINSKLKPHLTSSSHSQNKCPLVSSHDPQASHTTSPITWRWHRFSLVGKMFRPENKYQTGTKLRRTNSSLYFSSRWFVLSTFFVCSSLNTDGERQHQWEVGWLCLLETGDETREREREREETKGPFGWKSRKLGGWKISERMEKWEDRKYLVFSRVCLVGGMEKWEGGKLFCLVQKKIERIEM